MSQQKQEFLLLGSSDHRSIDHGSLAFMIMLLQGVGTLFPWNAFITASSYYGARFCGTSFENNFENFFSVSFTLAQTIGLAFAIVYSHQFSFESQIIWPLILYAGVFLVTTILVLITLPSTLLFWITLLSTCICGALAASLSSGLFGLAARFPPAYTGAMMTGQGIAGLTVALASIITTVSTPSTLSCDDDTSTKDDDGCVNTTDYGAFAYFFISTLVLVSCVLSYMVLHRLPFTKYHSEHQQHELSDSSESRMSSHSGLDKGLLDNETQNPLYTSINNEDTDIIDSGSQITSKSLVTESIEVTMSWSTIIQVSRKISSAAFSVFFIFTVTIGIFPGLIVFIESTEQCKTSNRFQNDLYVPFLFFIFNLFDFIGRFCAGHFKLILNSSNIMAASLLRSLFFPAFMLCNVSGSQLPKLFYNDACPIIFMMLFAFSNGYIASACMITGPTLVSKAESSLAGTIMIFSLTLGLLVGASVSFLVVLIARGSVV